MVIGGMALAAAMAAAAADPQLARMVALYDEICLKAFPDDKAVEGMMATRSKREFTPAEVKVTMRDDPARGWELEKGVSMWLEFPPFHACSVRWNAAAIGNLQAYRTVADAYEWRIGGFQPIDRYEDDQGDIHIRSTGEQRVLPDGTSESLFFFDQHITDPKRRAAGETGVVLRFVHQFAIAPPSGVTP
ncbi:hypothetical protein ACSBM8_05555 [Sphingomonas sp. ASY06-1R]|jgi:hypothetical protein|uniref:hypothetical protein n=1 Tax=Sphingomonas sp. ASY06-1R TaxID=3445771 RepID=UPI003FA1E866